MNQIPIQFDLSARPCILFGRGRVSEAGALAADMGWQKPLIVTDLVLAGLPIFDSLASSLNGAGLPVVVWAGEAKEPTAGAIVSAAAFYWSNQCDGLIAFGGGSAIDTAKGAGVLLFHKEEDPEPFAAGGSRLIEGCRPIMAVPTTAGSGSEATNMSLFKGRAGGWKALLRHDSLRPCCAVVDPELTLALPAKATLSGGVDAFCHAVECFTKSREHPYADALALAAAGLAFENLPRVTFVGEDAVAREKMSAAALLAGMALDTGGLQFHAFAHVLGVRFGLAHGLTCGLVLPAGLKQIVSENRDKLVRLAAALGLDIGDPTDEEAAPRTIGIIEGWLSRVGLPGASVIVPLSPADLPELSRATQAGLSRPMPEEKVEAIWKEVLNS